MANISKSLLLIFNIEQIRLIIQLYFSLLSKIYGGTSIENETIFPKGSEDQYLYPFLSIRKGGHGFKDKAKF